MIPRHNPKTLGTPYDYMSVMHYTQYAFAKAPNCVTMRTKEKCAQTVIGKAKVASYFDIKV